MCIIYNYLSCFEIKIKFSCSLFDFFKSSSFTHKIGKPLYFSLGKTKAGLQSTYIAAKK